VPIVLLHGTSASLHTWEGWVKALKGQRRVITFDLPGFGLTGPYTGNFAQGGAGYRPDSDARFVLDVLEHLKLERFAIGGNSLGGDIAWRVAQSAPERVTHLILVDSGGLAYTPEEFPLVWRIAKVPGLNRLLSEVLPRSLVEKDIASAYGDPRRITPELVDRYFELTLREGNRAALAQRMQGLALGAHADRIAKLRVPTLILWGRRDKLIPLAAGEEFARRIPGSRLVIYDDLGHVPQEEDPARTVQPARSFLGLG
jgi:pimeloyl-ACP methyl ester carboxylesterase